MISSIISGIVSKIKFLKGEENEVTPVFYQGAYDTLNQVTNDESEAFIFLLRPYKFSSDVKMIGNVNSTYTVIIGFFKVSNYDDNLEADTDTDVTNDLYNLYKEFLKELYKQGYRISSLDGDDVFNDSSLDNNVSGILSTMSIIVENEFNLCN